MVAKPPPSPPGAVRKRDLTELRVANLRREIDAETDPAAEASILYEVGLLYEHVLDRVDDACAYYERAASVDPLFLPASVARLRLAERSGTVDEALCEAQVAASRSGATRAAALTDLALQVEPWDALLAEAIAVAPEPVVPALLLEWLADANEDPDALRIALRAQAEHASVDELCGELWIDLALLELDDGDVEQALEALERASAFESASWRAHFMAVRIAREHDKSDAFVRHASQLADQLEAAGGRAGSDPIDLPVGAVRRPFVAALFRQEAAERCFDALADPSMALELVEAALRLRSDHPPLRLFALVLAEAADDQVRAAATAAWFEGSAPDDPGYSAYRVRCALRESDRENGIAELRRLSDAFPSSTYVRAALDVALMRAGMNGPRIDRLRNDAERQDQDARAYALWRAARLAARDGQADEAMSLYAEAVAIDSEASVDIARDGTGAAFLLGRFDRLPQGYETLLERTRDPEEQVTVSFARYDVLRHGLGEDEEADVLLRDALDDPAQHAWAPHIARVRAAWGRDVDLLAQAHEALSVRSTGEARVAHLCAAAQAQARAQRWDSAEETLRRALEDAPDDDYVHALLQRILRQSGRPEAAVSLVRDRSFSEPKLALDEESLLLAGVTAEREGNLAAARHAYEVAFGSPTATPSSALALLDIARRQKDVGATIRALQALAQSDIEGGVPEYFALLWGDALRFAGREEDAVTAYETALAHPSTAMAGAIGILTLPGRYTTDGDRDEAERIVGSLDASVTAFGHAYRTWRSSVEVTAPTEAGWLAMSEIAPSDALHANTRLQGLRTVAVLRGNEAIDDIFIESQRAEPLADRHVEAAVAIEETVSAADDPEMRASALRRRLDHGNEVGREAIEAAYARALVDAGRGSEAIDLLSRAVDERPEDLALWETLRQAARQAESWPMVALCCERLAQYVGGSLRGDLLEEAAVVRLERLGQEQQAEDLFGAALDADPARDVAFRRLHDLLTEKQDADALEELVSNRLAQASGEGRDELLYERARLLRGFSEREGALEVLEELLSVSPAHAGALALAAEVYVALERWEEAIEHLRRLADADIPAAQRRVARLGASDFLENRLSRRQEALAELYQVDALGLADEETLLRIGRLESELGNPESAVEAVERAVELDPVRGDSMQQLVELLPPDRRREEVEKYERAIWERIDRGELELTLIRGLGDAARWLGQPGRAAAVSEVEQAVEAGGSGRSEAADRLEEVPMDALAEPRPDETLGRVILAAGPLLQSRLPRSRARRGGLDPVDRQLESLCQRFGAALGTVGYAEDGVLPTAFLNRRGSIDWRVHREHRSGLRDGDLFEAGRLAWAVPRGAGALFDDEQVAIAATLEAVLRASGCAVDPPVSSSPRKIRLPRSVRRSIREVVPNGTVDGKSIEDAARLLQRNADRAGALAVGDIGVALARASGRGRPSIEALRVSERALALLHFWLDPSSPRWGSHG